jgi:hypothetical protein
VMVRNLYCRLRVGATLLLGGRVATRIVNPRRTQENTNAKGMRMQ